jgi:hypothetical protein
MSRSKFTQRDVARAAKGAKAAGLNVTGVEVDVDGRIRVIVGGPLSIVPDDINPFDRWLADHARDA